MKKLYAILILMFITAFLTACEEEVPHSMQKKAATVQNTQKQQEQDQRQSRGKKIIAWPFITDSQEETELADNFTAQNYILIFDGSGSMDDSECSDGRRKIDVAKEAVTEWSKTVPEDANLGLVAFHRNEWTHLKLGAGQRQDFTNAIYRLEHGGSTPLSKAFELAYKACTNQGQSQLGYGEYTIVVVTDGIANNTKQLSEHVNFILEKTPINIYSIGFCIGSNHSLNQPGRTVYKSANNPAELQQGLQEVLAESESFDESEFSN